jgi:hypothetical protein
MMETSSNSFVCCIKVIILHVANLSVWLLNSTSTLSGYWYHTCDKTFSLSYHMTVKYEWNSRYLVSFHSARHATWNEWLHSIVRMPVTDSSCTPINKQNKVYVCKVIEAVFNRITGQHIHTYVWSFAVVTWLNTSCMFRHEAQQCEKQTFMLRRTTAICVGWDFCLLRRKSQGLVMPVCFYCSPTCWLLIILQTYLVIAQARNNPKVTSNNNNWNNATSRLLY